MDRNGNSQETGYEQTHAERHKLMLRDIIKLAGSDKLVCNIGLSSFDKLAVNYLGDRYYCAVPNVEFLKSVDQLYISEQNIIYYDITKNNPEPNSKFDLVIISETLEHIFADDEIVMRSIANLLRPNGIIYLTVPNAARHINRIKLLFGKNIFWSKYDILNGGYGHIREYTVIEVKSMLEKYFDVRQIYGFNPYGSKLIRISLNLLPTSWRSTIVAIGMKRS
ncbi:methyltransferase domain-containing protein [Thermoplasma volcanium]|nr:methyltransferase domain-containing protein [Thermoplasma volcanium]